MPISTTGTPLLQRLRCGGSMCVCSVAYRLLDGTEFIGRGIAPDAECEISADDLRAGTDSVLREALRKAGRLKTSTTVESGNKSK